MADIAMSAISQNSCLVTLFSFLQTVNIFSNPGFPSAGSSFMDNVLKLFAEFNNYQNIKYSCSWHEYSNNSYLLNTNQKNFGKI